MRSALARMSPASADRPDRRVGTDVLVVGALILSAACCAVLVPGMIDISVADEALYMSHGLRLPLDGLPSPQWAPLYSIWYFALSAIQSDPVRLYDLNYTILVLAVPLLLYAHLRQSGVSAALAGVVAGLYLWSATNLDVWPYPSRFANLLLLLALISASAGPLRRQAGLVLVGALFLLSYVRPEYFVSWVAAVLVGGGGLLWSALHDRRQRSPWAAARIAGLAAVATAWMVLFGVPVDGGDRAEKAFAQHVAINLSKPSEAGMTARTDYGWVMRGVFKGARSAPEAFTENPAMFMRHVEKNARHYVPRLAGVALLRPSTRLVSPARGDIAEGAIALVVFIAIAGLLVSSRNDASSVRLLRAEDEGSLRLQLLALAAISCAVVAAALVIYPRPHYLQVQGLLLTILATRAVSAFAAMFATKMGWHRMPSLRAAAVCALLLMSSLGAAAAILRATPRDTPYRNTVLLLRWLRPRAEIRILAPTVASEGFNVYLDPSVVQVPLTPKVGRRGGLLEFLSRERVNLIVWPGQFANFSSYRDDPEYLALLSSPQDHGFVGLEVPGSPGLYVLVRLDSPLWNPEAPTPMP